MARERLVIVGAGGLGRILHDLLSKDAGLMAQADVAGFLDTRADPGLPQGLDCPVLGSPLNYQAQPGEVFVPAVGDPGMRKQLVEPLRQQDAAFLGYTDRATIGARTQMGDGVFMMPGVAVGTDCSIGAFAFLDTASIIGHDTAIGDYCMIGAMTFIAGGVSIGDGVTIHPRAVIAKGVRIGEGATIGIGSVVVKDVPPAVTVFGNPARII
jgi:sugar O-acyltransferase (sialic acid O-acetyltransferase NeuD family)